MNNEVEEDVESEQVMALAAALAPQMHELESLMDDPLLRSSQSEQELQEKAKKAIPKVISDDEDDINSSSSNHDHEPVTKSLISESNHYDSDDEEFALRMDDDDMDQELEQLAYAEDILRRELDLAKDFASFFGSSPMHFHQPEEPSGNFLNLNFNLSSAASSATAALTPANLFQTKLKKLDPDQERLPEETTANQLIPSIPEDEPLKDSSMDESNPFAGLPLEQHEADVDILDLREEEHQDVNSQSISCIDGTFLVEEAIKNAPEEMFDGSAKNTVVKTVHPPPQPPNPKTDAQTNKSVATPKKSSKSTSTEEKKDSTSEPKDTRTTQSSQTPLSCKETPNPSSTPTEADHMDTSTRNQQKYKTPSPAARLRRASVNNPTPPDTPQSSVVLFKSPSKTYTSTEHFHRLKLRKEPQGAWYSVDLTAHLVTLYDTPTASNDIDATSNPNNDLMVGMGIKEYCLSITQWKRLFVGLRLEGDDDKQQRKSQQQSPQNAAASPPQAPPPLNDASEADPAMKRAPVRTISIRIRPDVLCGAVMDAVTQTLVNCPSSSIIKRQGGHLQATVKGQVPPRSEEPRNSTAGTTPATPRYYLRTNSGKPRDCTFLVDVQLCTHKSVQCERVLLLRVFHWGDDHAKEVEEDMWSPSSTSALNATPSMTSPAPVNIGENPSETEDPLLFMEGDFGDSMPLPTEHDPKYQANLHLREACALIQRIESPELARKIRPLVRKSAPLAEVISEDLRGTISDHLLQNYRACPSVLQPDTTITLPALSPQDWPVIQAAWSWIHSVWDELETRELTYLSFLPMPWMTMNTTTGPSSPMEDGDMVGMEAMISAPPVPRFGAFPALPTLDVQYCSQLRRLSREAMIGQLLKAASVLEDYARQAEYQCANLIDLLRPTFTYYQVQAPSLPKPAPLASYPLDYTPPQSLCPPWGMKVMEALNQVAAMSHESAEIPSHNTPSPTGSKDDAMSRSLDSIALAETAVQMVYLAFQQQDDEEHSARLARKNLQVMDRLTKMQEHNRASIQALGHAATEAANAAADDFYSKAEKAIIGLVNVRRSGSDVVDFQARPWREVPLVKWTVGFGGSSGTCTITPNQILFTPTKLIPLLGYSQSTWFHLGDVEFDIVQTPATLLNPLTTTLKVIESKTGIEAYAFKPSSAGPRLKSFLDIVQKEACAELEKK